MATDVTRYLTPTSGQAFSGTNVYNGSALDLVNGTPRRGIDIRIELNSVVNTFSSTTGTIDFKIQDSDDGSTWQDRAVGWNANNVTTANAGTATASRQFSNHAIANGESWVHVETPHRYIRLVGTTTIGTGGSPVLTGTYTASVVSARY